MGTTAPAAEQPAPAAVPDNGAELPAEPAEDKEESIYEVMKATMRRQKEEQDVKNAAMRAERGRGQTGRPGPLGARPAPESAPLPPPIEKVADVTNLGAVWEATRRHLNQTARYLESVLGHCCNVAALARETGETLLSVPAVQKGFTNERARAKIEESMRVVTGLPIRLALAIMDEVAAPEHGPNGPAGPAAPSATAQRIPPELLEAVKAQPLVQELMKRLDASVVHVEMLNTDD